MASISGFVGVNCNEMPGKKTRWPARQSFEMSQKRQLAMLCTSGRVAFEQAAAGHRQNPWTVKDGGGVPDFQPGLAAVRYKLLGFAGSSNPIGHQPKSNSSFLLQAQSRRSIKLFHHRQK
jgi:hypothetical protein